MLTRTAMLFHRFAMILMLVAIPTVIMKAGEFDCGSDLIPAPIDGEKQEHIVENLCGWITHDSIPVPHPLSDRSLDDFDVDVQPIPLAALAGLASRGVHVEQWVEPFAMVGPFMTESFSDIDRLQAFWARTIETAEVLARRDADRAAAEQRVAEERREKESQLAAEAQRAEAQRIAQNKAEARIRVACEDLAAEEPIDAVEIELIAQQWPRRSEQAPIDITSLDPRVGGSAFVFTIEEEYHSYDLADADLPLWNPLNLPTDPFCFRPSAANPWDPDLDHPVASVDQVDVAANGSVAEPIAAEESADDKANLIVAETHAMIAAAEQLLAHVLDEIADQKRIGDAVEVAQRVGRSVRAAGIEVAIRPDTLTGVTMANVVGEAVASAGQSAGRIFTERSRQLAQAWPASAPQAAPAVSHSAADAIKPVDTVSRSLLDRAEATIAEAPSVATQGDAPDSVASAAPSVATEVTTAETTTVNASRPAAIEPKVAERKGNRRR